MVYDLIRNFARNFMEAKYVRMTPPMCIDPKDESKWLQINDIYLGMRF